MYQLMVEDFGQAIRGGPAPKRPPGASIALAELIDRLRASAGGGA
jgi:hypothetical protein